MSPNTKKDRELRILKVLAERFRGKLSGDSVEQRGRDSNTRGKPDQADGARS